MSTLTLNIDLPHDAEFEAHAVGMALQGNGGYGLLATLEPDDFHDAVNRSAWVVVQAIGNAGRTPDVLNVVAELEANGAKRDATKPLIEAAGNRMAGLAEPTGIVGRLKGLSMKRHAPVGAAWAWRRICRASRTRSSPKTRSASRSHADRVGEQPEAVS
jgi:hypothetical protein